MKLEDRVMRCLGTAVYISRILIKFHTNFYVGFDTGDYFTVFFRDHLLNLEPHLRPVHAV